MSIWGSLFRGAFQVGSWLARNSGNIKDVVTAVARIARPKGLKINEGQSLEEALALQIQADQNVFPTLVDAVDAADLALQTEAKIAVDSLELGSEFELDLAAKPIQMTGFWPTPDTKTGKSIPAVAGDINKLLTANRIPNTYTLPNGKQANLGDHIAREMFARPATVGTIEKTKVNDVRIADNKWIHGLYAYYPIPLGNKGYYGWHGCLNLQTYTRSLRGSEATDVDAPVASNPVTLQKSFAAEEPSPPYYVTTIQATFSGVSGTRGYMDKVIENLVRPGRVRLTQEPIIAGPVYLYKLESDLTIAPGAVLSEFATAAGATSNPDNTLPDMPQLEIVSNMVYAEGGKK